MKIDITRKECGSGDCELSCYNTGYGDYIMIDGAKAHEKETLKQNLDILNDHLLNGTRIQFKHSGDQWYNVTGKFKLEQLKHKSIKLRVRPDRVNIDGYMLTPKQAVDYINRNYGNG